MKRVLKIAITGGPCGGKTSALSRLKEHFEGSEFQALFIPESATELIGGGVSPHSCGLMDYERCEISLQLAKERLFEFAAGAIDTDKVLVFCDRGVHDNLAWMSDEEYNLVLAEEKTTRDAVLASYDAVFHLVTAAKGAEAFYSLENNEARRETLEEARDIDDKIVAAWQEHPRLVVIENEGTFEDKMDRLIAEIDAFVATRAFE